MRKRIRTPVLFLLLAVLVLVAPMQTFAAVPGEEVSATVTIAPGTNFYLAQVDYTLSAGLEYLRTETSMGWIKANTAGTKAIIVVIPPTEANEAAFAASGGTGSATITVYAKVKDDVTEDQSINFTDIQYAMRSNAGNIDPKNITFPIGESGTGILGDVDQDGIVTIADLLQIVDYILYGTDPTSFEDADLDDDGIITIQDVIWTVDIILYGAPQ